MQALARKHATTGSAIVFRHVPRAVFAALVCALATGSAPMPTSATSQPGIGHANKMDILPSLKSHMSRLETLMHFLFRNIDVPDKASELITTVDEMIVHLEQVERFTPDSVEMLVDERELSEAKRRFHACLERARLNLRELKIAIARAGEIQPKAALLKVDQTRRDCHAAFA